MNVIFVLFNLYICIYTYKVSRFLNNSTHVFNFYFLWNLLKFKLIHITPNAENDGVPSGTRSKQRSTHPWTYNTSVDNLYRLS